MQMLILATVFQCLDPILTITALLSSKPLFLNPVDNRSEASQYVVHKYSLTQLPLM